MPRGNAAEAETGSSALEIRQASIEGDLSGDSARLVIHANLAGLGSREPALYSSTIQHTIKVLPDKLSHRLQVTVDVIRGELRQIILNISGEGDVLEVTGAGLKAWSVRRGPDGARSLVVHLESSDTPVSSWAGEITAETTLESLPVSVSPLLVTTEESGLSQGFVLIETVEEIDARVENPVGVVPVELAFLPENMRPSEETAARSRAFRFHGGAYSIPLRISVADPEARQVVFSDFRLVGRLSDDTAAFVLSGVAVVKNPRGGRLLLLGGDVALSSPVEASGWRLEYDKGEFVAVFTEPGEYPIRLAFNAAVRVTNGWNRLSFTVASAPLLPVRLEGLPEETELELANAARPEREGDAFQTFLPASGRVEMAWRRERLQGEGRLFFAAEAVNQIAVSPGLLRQASLIDLRVMQGELNRVSFRLVGEGEVTRVHGPQVLAWSLEQIEGTSDRLLRVEFNQPQRTAATLQVEWQRPLGAFPMAIDVARLEPEEATRFAGYLRVVNEGAVRLEVVQSTGLSQISPEQFVETEATRALVPAQATQVFAYRFAGPGYQLRVQADDILPELTVSEMLVYQGGESESSIDLELEIEIREAPLRELLLRIPSGYALARLEASGLSDYFLSEPEGQPEAQLRLVYGTPVTGRQLVQMRLERDQPPGERWALPRIEVSQARSVRGHVGVLADEGIRLNPVLVNGLTELATAYFPKKITGLQMAFRISDPSWEAAFAIERLPQSIQADAFHLFSVGEGIAYGSSLITYVISGAPVATLQVELSDEYFNVEFAGKNIRNWQKTAQGFEVQLHTPVSGTYTLLATYERPFSARGETLTFTGARPLQINGEQGYTLVVSTYQFQVAPVNVSSSLLPLEPGEVPPEYRLFFDAPILAAYRYTARPFNLELELTPLKQGEVVSQIIDRAALVTRISEEGQVVTEARYFLKNKGAPHLRLRLPPESTLWSVTVDGTSVVPVQDGDASRIPLPHRPDPDVVTELQVKMASQATGRRRLTLRAPAVEAPVLLAEWHVQPADGRRLVYRGGNLTPAGGVDDRSGFATLTRLLSGENRGRAAGCLLVFLLATVTAAVLWSRLGALNGRRFGMRHWLGGALGLGAALVAVTSLLVLHDMAEPERVEKATDLRFVAPVQHGSSAWTLRVSNLPEDAMATSIWGSVLLWLLTLAAWIAAWIKGGLWRRVLNAAGWVLLFWSVLRLEHGLALFLMLLLLFVIVRVFGPAAWRAAPLGEGSPVPATAASLLLGLMMVGSGFETRAQPTEASTSVVPESVLHGIRVQGDFAFGTARIRWRAEEGDVLRLLYEPGILTHSGHSGAARLVQITEQGRRIRALVAKTNGVLEFSVEYQAHVESRGEERGFVLPVTPGLVTRARLVLSGLDVEVVSPQAMATVRETSSEGTNTVTSLVLAPAVDTWIGWRPRSRDTSRERSEFFAEWTQLYVPGPGVIEGRHDLQVRPARGEIGELTFEVPAGVTVTDVQAPALAFWRFDPDSRRLRVSLSPAQARPFRLTISSQVSAGTLPLETSVGLIRIEGAAGEVGVVGLATGNEVQLDDVVAEGMAVINLEDFPASSLEALRSRTAGLTIRRAYRYAAADQTLQLRASAVEPDVRVESRQTLSLGEDRVVLAATLDVEVIRAGIFKLSLELPPGLDVEAVSGNALSHWTELPGETARTVTLHLKGKTMGREQFSLTLSGPGVRSTNGWVVPRLSLREATKQRGQMVIVPEQGLRLSVARREGLTQLDPADTGVRQKGALAFRLLQDPWTLALDLEQVDAWIQVTSLQHISVSDPQARVSANLQYDIENTGVKSLLVRLPAAADNVRFRGEHISDFLVVTQEAGAGMRDWEVKLERRLIGPYLLQVSYTLVLGDGATNAVLDGVQALGVNLQRGFVTLHAGGRLQVSPDPPATLQPTEWQVIPRALQEGIPAPSATYAFRLVEPAFRLPVRLERHAAARLLPARVRSVRLTSVVADNGALLTRVEMQLMPGDKRLLHLRLPEGSRFWFAFVNRHSVWPWQTTNEWLIPLEQSARAGEPTPVEFFYSSSAGEADGGSLDLELLGPRFDLPLEDIQWTLFLNPKWRVRDWEGSLQLRTDVRVTQPVDVDLETYIRNEAQIQQEKTREAESFLQLGNSLLAGGDPQEARRAFQAAYGLSRHDQAFNEDARVQLNNLRMQQALVGLNVRQARVAGQEGGLAVAPPELRENAAPRYTQAEAQQLLARNSAEENAIQERLAERLIQQQDAAIASPAGIRATIPEQGRRLVFTRPLEVNTWSELRIGIEATAARQVSFWSKMGILIALFAAVLVLPLVVRRSADQRTSEVTR